MSSQDKVDSKIIPNQVKLPLSVAFGVVIQGLRIRLGRSIVTITGVTCGIAFLMSILTGQLVKSGVGQEDETRADVSREISFIHAGLGTSKLRDKPIAVVGSGKLSEVETRVLEQLVDDYDVQKVVFDSSDAPVPLRKIAKSATGKASDCSVVFIMGDVARPASFDVLAYTKSDNRNVVVSTAERHDEATQASSILEASDFIVPSEKLAIYKKYHAIPAEGRAQKLNEFKTLNSLTDDAIASLASYDEAVSSLEKSFVQAAREKTEEEIRTIAENKVKERFRSVWIGVISLLVTVIGIANAMLMSVTERFREIGTMKCLGALSSFVTEMFVLEASIMGLVGGIAGAIFGAIFAVVIYTITYGTDLVFGSLPLLQLLLFGGYSVIAGVVLSVVAAIYPARVAAGMVPATALRSNI